MKWFIVAGMMAISLGARAQSAFDTTIEATPGLLGYWNFTSTTTSNSAVNAYGGSFVGNAALASAKIHPPVTGTLSSAVALNLKGTPTGYLLSASDAAGKTALTGGINATGSLVAWFKLAALPSTTGRFFSIAGESAGGDDFDLQIETDNILKFYTDGGSNVSAPKAFTAKNVGKWIFVAATFTSDGKRTLYINGKAVATNTAGTHSANTATFYIGESPVFPGRYFSGDISDVAIFNTSLTAKQITAIWAARI